MSRLQQKKKTRATQASENDSGHVNPEHRRSKRQRCTIPVLLELGDGETLVAWTQNISAEGLLVEFPVSASDAGPRKGGYVDLVLNSPFLPGHSVNRRRCRIVETDHMAEGRGLLRLEAAEGLANDQGEMSEAIIRPSEYIVPVDMEMEFLKTLELIDFKLPDQASRVVVLTAAEEKAGASTFSWWFASCLARIVERKVLYIDGNLRQRKTGDQADAATGLLHLLQAKCRPEDAVVDYGPGCPRIMGSGNTVGYQSGEISAQMIARAFSALRQDYDYIVVDALPVRSSPLTLMLAREADGVLLVVQSRKTERDAACEAVDLLHQFNCRVLGAVLNRV